MAANRRRHYPLSVRPLRLHPDDIFDANADQTVGERIVQLLAIGMPLDHAGAAVGLSPQEIRHWMRAGINVLTQDAAGRAWESFTQDERALAHFAYAGLTAEGDWIARKHAQLEAATRTGGTTKTTTEVVNAQGQIERTVSERTLPGDPRIIMWQLERRFPNVYGQRATVDVLGVDVSNEPDTRERLRNRLVEIAQRLALPPGQEPPTNGEHRNGD